MAAGLCGYGFLTVEGLGLGDGWQPEPPGNLSCRLWSFPSLDPDLALTSRDLRSHP